ncbi:hypothetical protein D0859_00170 [Hortaea werneckii]|uniref:DUF6594 domain-containing protein n=1 Tax=Hortaea werneckii TaxID=91943 RepID=A0A3M7JD72_HORWE|nr:hypothetical protein D0859_00170 [Hortaea werneckii]
MTFLQHILKLQPLAAWKWLSTRRQKDPESEGDQPSPVTLDEYLPGFEEAAAFISAEDEGSMCRRSRRLTARNLLYMQSELASRKDKLHRMNQGGRRKIDTSEGVSALQCGTDRDSLRRLQSTDDERRQFAVTREQHYCAHPLRHTSPPFGISWGPEETGQSMSLGNLWKKSSRKTL